ncbi:MAG: glycosyltransferase [Candidatus Aenigmarchaeota archaeon]|nr:glycosyltransferase [Candidatus Aenigmarchaeota archaeon]
MKKRNSRVSVVIPAFNESKTIRKVVTAVMKAKNVDEIVVVDDGSTDGTSKNIEDLNIKIIRHTENKGKGEAIKTGIKNSIGKIILFLDADLENITSTKIEALIEPLLKNRADFVKASFKRPKGRGRITEFTVKPILKFLFPEMRFEQPIGGQFATKREFLEGIEIERNWGTDIGIFLDAIKWKLRIKEIYIGKLRHKKRPDEDLVSTAEDVVKTIFKKTGILKKIKIRKVRR